MKKFTPLEATDLLETVESLKKAINERPPVEALRATHAVHSDLNLHFKGSEMLPGLNMAYDTSTKNVEVLAGLPKDPRNDDIARMSLNEYASYAKELINLNTIKNEKNY